MSHFDFIFFTIVWALSTSILILALILINHIDNRTCEIKRMLKELNENRKDGKVRGR